MRSEPTEADRQARAVALAAYAKALAESRLSRAPWDDDLLAEVEYAESLMADAITERRAAED